MNHTDSIRRPVSIAVLSTLLAVAALAQFGDQWQPQIVANPVLTIAAADSSARAKTAAEYVCDGTDDGATINTAAAALPSTTLTVYSTLAGGDTSTVSTGGTLFLAAGSYNIDSTPIDMTGKLCIVLDGEGAATIVVNNQTDGGHAIVADVAAPASNPYPWRCEVRNMMIQGNSQSGYGVYWNNGDNQRLHNVHFIHNGAGGAYIGATEARGQNNKIISDCQFLRNYGHGLHLYNLHETLISNCHFEENGGTDDSKAGLYCVSMTDLHVSNCNVEDHDHANGVMGIDMTDAYYATFSSTVLEDYVEIAQRTGGYLTINGCQLSKTTITGSGGVVSVTGGKMEFYGTSSAKSLTISGASLRTTAGSSFAIAERCAMAGNEMWCTAGAIFTVTASSNNANIAISANAIHGDAGTLAVDGDGNSGCRCAFSANSTRTNKLVFEDLDFVTIDGNVLGGTGTLDFVNCDYQFSVTDNTSKWMTCTVDATCAATQSWQGNIVNGNLIQNGTGSVTNKDNIVIGGTGWNP